MADLYPRPDLETVELEGELMIFDPVRDETHILNETAAGIWRLIADRINEEEILDRMAGPLLPSERAALREALGTSINQMEQKGLLIRNQAIPATEKAAATFKPAGLPDGDDREFTLRKALQMLEEGEMVEGQALLESLHRRFPEDPRFCFHSARIAARLSRFEEARRLYREVLRLQPDHGGARINLANLYLQDQQPEMARQLLQPLEAGSPDDPILLGNLGVLHFQLGQWAEAEAALLKARSLDPENVALTFNLASLRYRQGRLEEAWELAERAERKDPGNAHILSLSGRILTALNRLAEARERQERALRENPDLVNVRNELALVHLLQDRLEEAEIQLQAARKVFPDYPPTWRHLGLLHWKRGNAEIARTHLERGLTLDPGDWLARYHLAAMLYKLGDPEGSLREGTRCLELNPTCLQAGDLLVRIHLEKGDRVGAWEVYGRVRPRATDLRREDFPFLSGMEKKITSPPRGRRSRPR